MKSPLIVYLTLLPGHYLSRFALGKYVFTGQIFLSWKALYLPMIGIGLGSLVYFFLMLFVCTLLIVLYFCECGANRDVVSMNSNSSRTIDNSTTERPASKLLNRHEIVWYFLKSSWNAQTLLGKKKSLLDLLLSCVAQTSVERTEHLQRKQSNCQEIRDYDQLKVKGKRSRVTRTSLALWNNLQMMAMVFG